MRKRIIIFAIIIISISFYVDRSLSLAQKDVDLFKGALSAASAETVEYGIKASFEISEEPERYCLDIFKSLNIESKDTTVVKKDENYCLEFNNSDLKGYIESVSYDNHNVVTIYIIQNDNINRVSELKSTIEKSIAKHNEDIKMNLYLKAKINGDSTEEANKNIIRLLKAEKFSNIDTVQIENGFSTVAYTKKYISVKSNGKPIDINIAVCSYSSGNYLIIGTPVIMTTY